jgi:hypothetical protein
MSSALTAVMAISQHEIFQLDLASGANLFQLDQIEPPFPAFVTADEALVTPKPLRQLDLFEASFQADRPQ